MTIASAVNICFYGLNRSLSFTIDSINKYLFEGLSSSGIECEVYGCFSQVKGFANSRSNELGSTIQHNEGDLIRFAEVKYIDQDTLDDSIPWNEVFEFGDIYSQILDASHLSRKDSTAKNIFRSLWCLKSSFALIPEERREFPTIFVRPDLEILSEINWSFYFDLLNKKPRRYAFGNTEGVALLPSWHSWDGLNDRFALCSRGNASIAYANRFDSLLPYIKMSRHPLHPETFLLHVLQSSRVEAIPIISTCMARIRSNGESQNEDFAQGGKIYSMQTETLSGLHKLLQERTRELESLQQSYQDVENQKIAFQEQLDAAGAHASELLDKISFSDRELLKLKTALNGEVEELKVQLLDKNKFIENIIDEKADLLNQLGKAKEDLGDAQAAAELTMTQLLQVQEELEHYYLMSRQLKDMISKYSGLKERSLRLIGSLAKESTSF